ncbi:B-box zinc finger protein [Desulfosporosinus sp. OT]|uniref:B-box zinc finger protein n=1 Tax=Desulfosporosinus sp. OT TaxID=913865 RepID=UPI0002239E5E|nr:B-box zinc finger protein [Desulfosporosinus sp. OT]EGW39397.1 hypothetical protein DOT_2682 [Desulfosporosinus sp. OT]
MNCNYHSTQEAKAICEKCKQPICPECTINVDDKTICRPCIQKTLTANPVMIPKKTFLEKFLFFCYSLIPGAAHMHMGLFRRGLQFMLVTFGGASLISFMGLDFLIPLVLIPTWFFSFFESYHLKNQLDKGQRISDQDLFAHQLLDYTPLLKNRRLIGSVITVIGLISLIHELDRSSFINRLFGNYYYLLRGSLVPLCLIMGGIYLIIKAKIPKETISNSSEQE